MAAESNNIEEGTALLKAIKNSGQRDWKSDLYTLTDRAVETGCPAMVQFVWDERKQSGGADTIRWLLSLRPDLNINHLHVPYIDGDDGPSSYERRMREEKETLNSGHRTILHAAAFMGNIEMVQALLVLGANPELFNGQQATAEAVARKAGHDNVAEVLMRASRDMLAEVVVDESICVVEVVVEVEGISVDEDVVLVDVMAVKDVMEDVVEDVMEDEDVDVAEDVEVDEDAKLDEDVKVDDDATSADDVEGVFKDVVVDEDLPIDEDAVVDDEVGQIVEVASVFIIVEAMAWLGPVTETAPDELDSLS
ncbi:hypothetical protein HJFPF1_07378 [Paramyrothecium foliicola]|nr:hypothetical protein HJFPF1_07378 [Paramyrothecium foliicola]